MEKLYTRRSAPSPRKRPPGEKRAARHIKVPSFTAPGVLYDVDPESGTCTCGRGRFSGDEHKHVRLARSGAPLEGAYPGILSDGSAVLFVDGVCHGYDSRVWGFDAGLWDHCLCFDGDVFLLESVHLATGEVRTLILHDWREWKANIPFHRDAP